MLKPSDVCAKLCDLPYGVAANMHDSENFSTKRQTLSTSIVSAKDRTLNTAAFILSFAVGNSLP